MLTRRAKREISLQWFLHFNLLIAAPGPQHMTGRKRGLKIPVNGSLSWAANMELYFLKKTRRSPVYSISIKEKRATSYIKPADVLQLQSRRRAGRSDVMSLVEFADPVFSISLLCCFLQGQLTEAVTFLR